MAVLVPSFFKFFYRGTEASPGHWRGGGLFPPAVSQHAHSAPVHPLIQGSLNPEMEITKNKSP
jgi:hypothetical protein